MLADDPGAPRDSSWTMNPGGAIEKECHSKYDVMHYKGECLNLMSCVVCTTLMLSLLGKNFSK